MNHNINTDDFHSSMKNHPEPGPPMMVIYHQDHAPKGKTVHQEEGIAELRHSGGWVDTPAKFDGNNSASQDSLSADAKRDAVVDKIVREEVKKQGKAGIDLESEIRELAAEQEEEERPEFGPGAFEGKINESDEQLDGMLDMPEDSAKKILVNSLMEYKLLEKQPAKTAKVETLIAKFKKLRDEHNATVGA